MGTLLFGRGSFSRIDVSYSLFTPSNRKGKLGNLPTFFATADQMQETLGQGTYGKVVKCYDHVRRTYCAIKIIRAIQKYREASQTEIRVLNTLKEHDQLNFK